VSPCLTDLELERWLVGELADPHVRDCTRCRDELATKRAVGDAYMRSTHARELANVIVAAERALAPRRMVRIGVAIAGAIAAIALVVVIASGGRDREAEVLAVTREWMDAYRHNDADALERILADDYKLTDGAGHTSTKLDDLVAARSKLVRLDAYDTSNLRVRVWGDTAVVTGHSVVRGARRGEPFVRDFTFTDTLARIDGRWRAVAAHVTRSQ